MTVEVLTVLSIQIGGMAVVLTTGTRQLRFLVPVGFIAGLCIHIVIAALQSGALLRTRPYVTITLTMLLPLAWWYVRHRQGAAARPSFLPTAISLALVGLSAAVLHAVDRVNFHVDSHEYLAIGSMLVADTFRDGVSMFQIEKRMLVVPLQHAPANLSGDYFLVSLNPLLGIATVFLLAWLCETGLRLRSVDRRTSAFVAVTAALLLLTINRFVHNIFYINSHLLVATLLLVLGGTSWVISSRSADDRFIGLLPIQLVAIPVLVIARPEAALLAALVIAPTVLSRQRPVGHRIALVTVLGGSVVAWQLFLIALAQTRGIVTTPMLGMLAFGAFLLAAAPLLLWRALEARPIVALSVIEGLLWVALFGAAVRDPDVLVNSVRATAQNTLGGTGGWGYSLAVLAVLGVMALAVTRAADRLALRYPLTTFVPLVFLLAYLREGAYRAHAADSLNRMLIHIVPIAILFLASTAAATWVRLPWTRLNQNSRAP